MDYLQYLHKNLLTIIRDEFGFKPYYKWITFNTFIPELDNRRHLYSFKPYYKWITFNT